MTSEWKQCPHCDERFALQSSLNKHLKAHDGDAARLGEIVIRARWPRGMKSVIEVVAEDENGIRHKLNVYEAHSK